jgi:hypothetical protein
LAQAILAQAIPDQAIKQKIASLLLKAPVGVMHLRLLLVVGISVAAGSLRGGLQTGTGTPSPNEPSTVATPLTTPLAAIINEQDPFMDEYLQEWHANNNYDGSGRYDGNETDHAFLSLKSANHNQGQVKALYTIGSPASGSPGLKPITGSCFPGVRVFSKEKCRQAGSTAGCYFDPIVWYAQSAWLWHPLMESAGVSLDSRHDESHACGLAGMKFPPYQWGGTSRTDLHSTDKTYNRAILSSELPSLAPYKSSSQQLADISYEQNNVDHAQALARQIGYNVVGAAKFEGSWSEGLQV